MDHSISIDQTVHNSLEQLYLAIKPYSVVNGTHGLKWTHLMRAESFFFYNIPPMAMDDFHRLYVNCVKDGFNPAILEKHRSNGPIVIEIRFVTNQSDNIRFYTNQLPFQIVSIYNDLIKKYLSTASRYMIGYVAETDAPYLKNGFCHDVIRIVYPYLCTNPAIQLLMRDDFLSNVTKNHLFSQIPIVTDTSKVFDENVILKNGWLMYGSAEESSVHQMSHIYQLFNEQIVDTYFPDNTEIAHYVDVFSCRRFKKTDNTPLSNEMIVQKVNEEIDKLRLNLELDEVKYSKINKSSDVILQEAEMLINLLSNTRVNDDYSWYQIGRCLHAIDYRLLESWIKFTEKCPTKMASRDCKTLWDKMELSNFTITTLHYLAAIDNPTAYAESRKRKMDKYMRDGIEGSNYAIAKLLIEKHGYVFKCASIKHNLWYQFVDHRWIAIDTAYTLKLSISNDLFSDYVARQIHLLSQSVDPEQSTYDKMQLNAESVKIEKLKKSLNSNGFKKAVIAECADIAFDPTFFKHLDENNYLIGFDNGVYDLKANVFREGYPDDYISLTTGYSYRKHSENSRYYRDIMDFMKKIQPVKIMRDYVMTLLSTCLSGSICEESFYVFTGSGANGKSKLMELMKHTLGELFKPMDVAVITGKKTSSSSATPELADKKGIRICPLDEPRATDEINTGFMKIFTGGDTITARALYSEPIYFKPQFKPFLLCNITPNIKSDDDGTWRRLKVVPFLSKFIKKSEWPAHKPLPEDHFWADDKLSEKLMEWRQTFMSILIDYFAAYRAVGCLKHPDLVIKNTEDYRQRCDLYRDFVIDYLIKTGNDTDRINVSKLHEGMKVWYRSNHDGKCPSAKELANYLNHRMTNHYDKSSNLLVGYAFKMEEGTITELCTL